MNNTVALRLYMALLVLLTSLLPAHSVATELLADQDLFALSIDELMNIKINTVSKKEEVISDAAASIYVVTSRAIRNSGVTSLPEALRLAPGLQVNRTNGTQYAISARGFGAIASNKLLVLIDGRTVYTPLFSGVFWDHQDLMLEDIERIEVITGPGGTLWGTNAVNGVINIITKDTSKTTGALISAYGGTDDGLGVRYGDSIGDTGHFRIYTKVSGVGETERAGGAPQFDGAEKMQFGFRTDWHMAGNWFTFQGDTYQGEEDDRGIVLNGVGAIAVSGSNLLARWQRRSEAGSDLNFQIYWDRMKRRDAFLFQPKGEILDMEFHHSKSLGAHSILWGLGYRHSEDEVDPGLFTLFIPDGRSLEWKNLFIQDEIPITESLTGTVGLKLEHNDYTGTEYLPNLRLAWKYSEHSLIWSAVSRAIRAPSRFDREIYAFHPQTLEFFVIGGPDFRSEVANVFELGYRSQMGDKWAYSITAYYHDWDKLRSGTAPPTEFENQIEGEVYGLEFWTTYDVTSRWHISAGGFRMEKHLRLKPGSTDPTGVDNDTLGDDPDYQLMVRSDVNFSDNISLHLAARHNAKLPVNDVPAYTSIDGNLIWHPNEDLEIAVAVQNLADKKHREFLERDEASELGRMFWLKLSWRQ